MEDFAGLVKGLGYRRERDFEGGATLDARLTRMHRPTAGWRGECEGRQPWRDVVGGIVERVVCEVFMVNVVGELGITMDRV